MVITLNNLIKRFESEPPIPMIWGIVKKGSFGMFFGPSRSGKTCLTETLGLSLANGSEKAIGETINKDDYRILYLGLEEFCGFRAERNAKQVKELGISDSYLVVDEEFPRRITNKQELELLIETIKQSEVNVVFIDSFTRLYSGDIETSSLAQAILFRLRELVNELGITLIIIHHTVKLEGKPITLDSLAGSRVIAQECDFLLGINKTPNGTRYLKEVSARYKQEKDNVNVFRINDNYCVEFITEAEENQLLMTEDGRISYENMETIINVIKIKGTEGMIPANVLYDEIVDKVMPRTTYYDNLKRLEKQGLILKVKGNIIIQE